MSAQSSAHDVAHADARPSSRADDELTVDELATAADIPVRRIRFYAGKKLLPPPRLEGRTGLYGPAHLARLQLIADLQEAGYTLAAIEEFLESVPDDADADAVELVGTLVAPGSSGPALVLTREELHERLGRELDDQQVAGLERANLLHRTDEAEGGVVHLTQAQLEFARRMLAVDAPLDALVEAGEVVRRHARSLAEDLQAVFEQRILAEYDDPDPAERTRLRETARALRPLTIQAIVTAYQESLEQVVRESRAT